MKIDFGVKLAEFHYSFINKKIFVEEYMGKNWKIISFYAIMESRNMFM